MSQSTSQLEPSGLCHHCGLQTYFGLTHCCASVGGVTFGPFDGPNGEGYPNTPKPIRFFSCDPPTKNSEMLAQFSTYCQAHPEERFWQALRNWADRGFIYVSDRMVDGLEVEDTFYWESRNK